LSKIITAPVIQTARTQKSHINWGFPPLSVPTINPRLQARRSLGEGESSLNYSPPTVTNAPDFTPIPAIVKSQALFWVEKQLSENRNRDNGK
jgi:hypothetical protein